jgi:hypothetical protein
MESAYAELVDMSLDLEKILGDKPVDPTSKSLKTLKSLGGVNVTASL